MHRSSSWPLELVAQSTLHEEGPRFGRRIGDVICAATATSADHAKPQVPRLAVLQSHVSTSSCIALPQILQNMT